MYYTVFRPKPKKDSNQSLDSEDLFDWHSFLIVSLSVIIGTCGYNYLNDPYYYIYSNPVHSWCFLVIGAILINKISYLLETAVLKLLSITSGTRVWKVYYYAQAMQSILSSLITVAFCYYFRYFSNQFIWDYNLTSWFDPLLKFWFVLTVCIFIRGLFTKHLTYIINEQRYTKAVTDLIFKARVLARLCDREAYQPIPAPGETITQSLDLNNAENYQSEDIAANNKPPTIKIESAEESKESAVEMVKAAVKPKKKKVKTKVSSSSKPHALYEMFSRLRDWNESVADDLPGGTGRGFFSSEKIAVAKAKLLFQNVDREKRGYLTINDFRAFFPNETALRAFKLFFPPKTFKLVKTKKHEANLPSKEPPAPFNMIVTGDKVLDAKSTEKKKKKVVKKKEGEETNTTKKKLKAKEKTAATTEEEKTNDETTRPTSSEIVRVATISRSKSSPALNESDKLGDSATGEGRTSLSLLLEAPRSQSSQIEELSSDFDTEEDSKSDQLKWSSSSEILTEGNVLEDVTTTVEDEEEGSSKPQSVASEAANAITSTGASILAAAGITSKKKKKKVPTAGSLTKQAKADFESHIQSLKLTEDQLEARILGFCSSRQTLSRQLRDLDGLADVMASLTQMIFYVVIALVCVIVFDEHIQPLMFALSTMLLSMTFIFADTLKNIFKAIILIFAVKPYQVGDRVNIGKNKFRVHSIQLLTTTFKDLQNKINIMPNSTLSNMLIQNLSRSGNVVVKMKLSVAFDTPATKLAILRQYMVDHVTARPAEWKPNVSMHLATISPETNTVAVSILISHLATYTQVAQWKRSKTELTHLIREKMIELNINWCNPKHSVQVINNTSMSNFSLKQLTEQNSGLFPGIDIKHVNPITGQIDGKLEPQLLAAANKTAELLSPGAAETSNNSVEGVADKQISPTKKKTKKSVKSPTKAEETAKPSGE